MRTFARALQLLGLVLPLTGLMMALQQQGGQAMVFEMGLLGLGVVVFVIGVQLQKRAE